MALTPEDISQKSFSPRFRGIDPGEVREFLLLAAAQITELHEQIRQQKNQLDDQEKELALAADDKKSFDDVLEVFKQKIDTLTAQLGETKKQESSRGEELDRLKPQLEAMQRERDSLKAELGRLQASLAEVETDKQKIAALTNQLNETRQQQAHRDEELARVKQSLEGVQQEREQLKGELGRAQASLTETDAHKQKIDALAAELDDTKQQLADRDEELARAQQSLEGVQREREQLKGELGRAQTSLSEAESKSRMSRAAIEGLRNRIVVIEAEKTELISAAEEHQKLLDEARHQSGETTEETRLQTERMIAEAREEIAEMRTTASQELAVIREEIDQLHAQRRQLHSELRDLLHSHLDRLSEYATGAAGPTRSEYDELFQKIDLTEMAELEEFNVLEAPVAGETAAEAQSDEDEETLRTKLQDGGIAYLSDE